MGKHHPRRSLIAKTALIASSLSQDFTERPQDYTKAHVKTKPGWTSPTKLFLRSRSSMESIWRTTRTSWTSRSLIGTRVTIPTQKSLLSTTTGLEVNLETLSKTQMSQQNLSSQSNVFKMQSILSFISEVNLVWKAVSWAIIDGTRIGPHEIVRSRACALLTPRSLASSIIQTDWTIAATTRLRSTTLYLIASLSGWTVSMHIRHSCSESDRSEL